MPYLATVDGNSVGHKAEQIGDEVMAAIVTQLDHGFEATNIEWAEGMYNALSRILSLASPGARKAAFDRMKELCNGLS